MAVIVGLLPKVLVFGVAALLSGIVASVGVAAMQDRTPQSTAGLAPEYTLGGADTPIGPGPVAAFDEEPAQAEPVPTLSPEDLAAVSEALLGGEPVTFVNPSGFPRIPPVTQFDGGPFQGANCTLASGAMLARLGYGIVTSGSTLRTLQDDQDGGTGLDDLATALWRGYGISFKSGLLRPDQLKSLLAAGYGAVVQGDYSKVPVSLRLQKDFSGGHAVYLDGYYPGNAKRGIPEAYYVIDPIGRPKSGYEGDWWPASVVDAFAAAFAGGRVAAMWGFPPGGVPPEVVGPDVLPLPPDPGGGGPGSTPDPSASAEVPSAEVPSDAPSGPLPPDLVLEPGDLVLELPAADPPVSDAGAGGIIVVPVFDFCLVSPPPAGCPTGLEAVFDLDDPPVLQLPLGPDVDIVFVDSDKADIAIVGFTVDPPAVADVHFWVDGVSPATVHSATSMSSIDLFGTTVLLARLDTTAATTYRFQAVAGSGLFAGASEIGTFTTGSGIEQFDVALSQAVSPVIKLDAGLSPYLHLAEGAFAQPMVRLDGLGGATCLASASFGELDLCVDLGDVPPPDVCTRAQVTYAVAGIEAESVVVRAFPAEEGVTPDGAVTLEGVLEASGAMPAGEVSVGCLTSGLTYHIALDAVGDDRGVLAFETVTIP